MFKYTLEYPELIHKAVDGLKNIDDTDIIMILGYIDRLQKCGK